MQRWNSKALTAAVVVAGLGVTGAVVPAGVASKAHIARTYSVKFKNVGNPQNLNGKLSGSFGNGRSSGRIVVPKLYYNWKYSGGVIHATGKAGAPHGSVYTGVWKITNGTGKFKGITGHGTFSGDPTGHPVVFHFKGTVSCNPKKGC